jgi:3-dehydroquinate dehydratase-2
MQKILLLNGPNLNLLGNRQTEHYGQTSLTEINQQMMALGKQFGYQIECKQSNAEYELITWIHEAPVQSIDFILFNPAAFTHTSIALRDALLAVNIPFIEIHLSNIYGREAFRQQSFFSDIAYGIVAGFGSKSYELALMAATHYLSLEKVADPRQPA